MNQTKICTTCKTEKELIEFSLAKLGKLGRAAKCKDCKKQFYQDNIEKITAANIAYKETHKAEITKRQKDYAESEKGRQVRAAYRARNKKEVKPVTKRTKEEIAAYQKEYRQKNKDALFQQKKEYREANKEIIQERKRKYRQANRDKLIEQDRKYYADNKTQLLEKCKIYRQENKAEKAARDKLYRQNNKVKCNAIKRKWEKANKDMLAERRKEYLQTPKGRTNASARRHKRRALLRDAPGSHTAQDILNLFDQQSGKCPYCQVELSLTKRNSFHVDHVVPLSKGGSNSVENLQLTCPQCNLSKSDKLPEIFAQQVGILL